MVGCSNFDKAASIEQAVRRSEQGWCARGRLRVFGFTARMRKIIKGANVKSVIAFLMTSLLAGALHAATPNPDAAQVKAAHDLLASMQAEKMMRMTAGMSRYASPEQRKQVMDKVIHLQPEFVYTRLATPIAKLLSTETLLEMTRYYQSSYGKKVLEDTYNSKAQMYPTAPKPTPAEQVELKKPAYLKADKEFKANEEAIHHETFVLLKDIINSK
jgi:hypothetical protein